MSAPTSEGAGELADLRAKVADLEAQLAHSRHPLTLLQNSDDLIRRQLNGLGTGVGVFTADLSMALHASVTIERLFGCTQEQIRIDPACWMRTIEPEDLPAVRRAIETAVAGKLNEVRCRVRRDGALTWVRAKFSVIRAPEAPACVGMVCEDVTEQVRGELAVRASEERLTRVLDATTEGIWEWDLASDEVFFSRRWCESLGYTSDEIEPHARTCQRLMHADDAPVVQAKMAQHLAGKSDVFECERRLLTRENTWRRYLCRGRVVDRDGTGRPLRMIGVDVDIDERKRTENLLRESEKLAATGRIAGRIAHEINNPLAGIKNSFLLIKDAIPEDHAYFKYVGRIDSEIDRIARIVRQMFDLYRPDQAKLHEFQLDDAVREVAALASAREPERDVIVDLETSSAGGPVRLPEDSVRHVLYNIIANGIEASPPGGIVRVAAAHTPEAIEVFISDEGKGIAPQVREHIYEPFFTTKSAPQSGALGLGLPISRGIVEAMQGTLDFESSAAGTVFRVRIPIGQHEGEAAHG